MSAVLKLKNYEAKELYPVQEEGKPMAETQIHINQIIHIVSVLENFFQNISDMYVAGDMTFYYEEKNPKKFIVPDVFVVKGISKESRRVFRLWEEKPPIVVFEISSRKTWGADLNQKWKLYEQIGVQEYYIFDPEYDYLPEPLVAYRLNKHGELKKITVRGKRIFSEALGLEIFDKGEGLRFFNPQTKEILRNLNEAENAFHGERNLRLQAESEIEKLRAELERLKK